MTRPTFRIVVAIVYGTGHFGFAVLSSDHLHLVGGKSPRCGPEDVEAWLRAELNRLTSHFRPALVCEVVNERGASLLARLGSPILQSHAESLGIGVHRVTRGALRARHCEQGFQPSNDAVGRAVLSAYPELAALYGGAETLGRTKYPTSRERYLYLLFLAIAGAEVALYANIL